MGGARAELEGYDTILTRWEFGRLLDQPNVLCDPRCHAMMNNKHNSHNEPTTVEVRVAMGVGDLYYGGVRDRCRLQCMQYQYTTSRIYEFPHYAY